LTSTEGPEKVGIALMLIFAVLSGAGSNIAILSTKGEALTNHYLLF
jgi:hypothetical protein